MDIKKVTADILNGPNWGTWAVQIQVVARVLNCWSVIKGERIMGTTLPTYNLLKKPMQGTGAGQIANAALFVKALFKWNKMNSITLGLIQGKLNPVLWPDYVDVSDAAMFWTHLETKYRKARGANTYLQFVGMIKMTVSDRADLLSQIQKFQENYQCMLSNGHSTITEDLVVFMFCSALPDSYQDTSQYLNNIDDITKYKMQPIIDQVIQEEPRRKARNATASSSSSTIHKFSTTKKYEKHCAKCGKNNHNTRDHWDTPPQRQGGGLGSGGGSKKKGGSQKKKGGVPQKARSLWLDKNR